MPEEEMVTITRKEYEELKEAAGKFYALEGEGVDNWQGWDKAMQSLKELVV